MIAVRTRGNFDNTEKYLKGLASKDYRPILDAYARRGLEALINATPVDTGITAESWGYKIQNDSHGVSITPIQLMGMHLAEKEPLLLSSFSTVMQPEPAGMLRAMTS